MEKKSFDWKELFDLSLLRNPRVIAFGAIIIALDVVLNQLAFAPSPLIEFNFNYIAHAMGAFLLGPVIGGICAAIADIIGFFLRPNGSFFFGFTLNAVLGTMIYGFFFYKRPVSWKRVLIAAAIVTVIVSFILTPLWLQVMGYKDFVVSIMSSTRYLKAAIMYPIRVILVFSLLKFMENIKVRERFRL